MSEQRSLKDWALLMALVAMWGSAFLFIKLGVATVPPATLVAARLALGTAVLLPLVYMRGLRLPPLGGAWLPFIVMALIGNAVPFYLITWGQQTVPSALAGILMAIMPLATMVLAHFAIAGERMTRHRVAGFAIGFVGITFLMGPAALGSAGGPEARILAQFAILAGALCYAANSVLARRLVTGDFLVTSTAMLLVATIVVIPIALVLDRPWELGPTVPSILSIVWLGIGPTAVATICYFRLISSAGPTFMSIVNYLSPCIAVGLGVTLLGEKPDASAYAGLALILSGIALSQLRRR
jgi:drug/metabolite transporter (DMT)-like permease